MERKNDSRGRPGPEEKIKELLITNQYQELRRKYFGGKAMVKPTKGLTVYQKKKKTTQGL